MKYSENYKHHKLKFLNLVLYSKNNEYDDMYELTKNHYKKYKNVDTIYYLFSNDIDENYKYDRIKNILIIKGNETYLPGILDKTIKAFKYVETIENINGVKYDYIIRSNISTVINFDKLCKELVNKPVSYGGGFRMKIFKGWRDHPGGIIDDRYEGVEYASGTSIIISRDLLNKMLKKINLIDYNVIDDVSIGQFIMKNFPEYKLETYDDVFLYTNSNTIGSNIDKYILF